MPRLRFGMTATRSPIFQPARSTSAPSSTISPDTSAPGIIGIGVRRPGMPRRIMGSKPLRLTALTWTRHSPGAGRGSGMSSTWTFSRGPCAWKTTALMRRLQPLFRRFHGRGASGDAPTDEAFSEVAAGHIEMPEGAAELAGGVEARDRRAEGINDALVLVVARAALGVGHNGPELRRVIGRLGDRHHAAGRAAELCIVPVGASPVPARNGIGENGRIPADRARELRDPSGATDQAELDLRRIIGAPIETHGGIVVGRPSQRIALASGLVGDQPAGNPCVSLAVGVVGLERARAGVLQIGRV